MSMHGEVTFYRDSPLASPVEAACELVQVCGVKCANAWVFQHVTSTDGAVKCEKIDDSDKVVDLHRYIRAHMRSDRFLGLFADRAEPISELGFAMQRGLPPEVRGRFLLQTLSIGIGKSGVLDWVFIDEECLEEQYDSHAYVSFNGLNYTGDPERFRTELFLLPEVLAIQRRLETVLGPLRHAAWWES